MSNIVNINELEYEFDDLTDTAKTAYQQLLSLQNQHSDLVMHLDQVAAAQSVFEQALQAELEKVDQPEEAELAAEG
jgi:hypothetical protein